MRKSKFEDLVNQKGGVKSLVEQINALVEEGKSLTEIGKDFGVSRSTISLGLNSQGYRYVDKKYVKLGENKAELTAEEKDMLLFGKFSQQVSFKVDGNILEEFQNVAKEVFPNLTSSKCHTLALKLFIDKYKKHNK